VSLGLALPCPFPYHGFSSRCPLHVLAFLYIRLVSQLIITLFALQQEALVLRLPLLQQLWPTNHLDIRVIVSALLVWSRFQIFNEVKMYMLIFCIIIPCGRESGYHLVLERCCFSLQCRHGVRRVYEPRNPQYIDSKVI
jgi:hypothetical protein